MTDQKSGYHHVEIGGILQQLHVPNDTMSGDDFYISLNAHDVDIYGDVTTALVRGQMEAFYILNGDHIRQYAELIDVGFDACMAYFEQNIDRINKHSDRPEAEAVPGQSVR